MHKSRLRMATEFVAPWLESRGRFITFMVVQFITFMGKCYYVHLWLVDLLHLWLKDISFMVSITFMVNF